MENKLGMVGMGRVENGVIKFMDANGKGFIKPVSVRREPVIKNEVFMIEEEIIVENKPEVLDIPDFMKSRKKPEVHVTTVYLAADKFKKEEKTEEDKAQAIADAAEELIDAIVDAGKKAIKRNPVFKYFFGEDE